MNEKFAKLSMYAPVVVRVGISLVFLWFGTSQVGDPESWTRLLPDWTASLPFAAETLIKFNGGFEILFGTLLLLGLYVRPVALLLALHLFHVVSVVGYNGIGVRDFGLALATTSIFLHGSDHLTLDALFARRRSAAPQQVSNLGQ